MHFFVWISSFIAAVPNILVSNIQYVSYNWENLQFCSQYPDNSFNAPLKTLTIITNSLIYYFIPLAIFIYFQVAILIKNKNETKTNLVVYEKIDNLDIKTYNNNTVTIVRFSSLGKIF